jgi:gamma-glutamyltranspeptidase/glutathione hydrolase
LRPAAGFAIEAEARVKPWRVALAHGALAVALASLPSVAFAQPAPEGATGFTPKPAVEARRQIVVTGDARASDAALDMLRRGGSAIDAAIAAQLVLGLVEPQSSGLGGGGFILGWSQRERRLMAFDGRETAPAAAREDLFLAADGRPLGYPEAIASGRSVGVPGLVRLLALAHRERGRLSWAVLFEPAIRLAEEGFEVSPRLAALVAVDPLLPASPAARAYLFDAEGTPVRAGARLRNPALAEVMRAIAAQGAQAFYAGDIARDVISAVAAPPLPGSMTLDDLARYRALERKPLCGAYRAWRVCGMPPPSSGAGTVLAILGALERFPMTQFGPDTLMGAHLFAEAGKLAYADRDRYYADPAFVDVPVAALVDRDYLRERSAAIRFDAAMARAEPGVVRNAPARGVMAAQPAGGTTHISVIDAEGNAVAMTTSIESAFGSRRFVRGFFLNNQLTDFSFLPERDGMPIANRVEPGKRPRSAMAPTMVFDPSGRLVLVTGSPGGRWIPNFVARSLVAALDWKLPAAEAVALPHVGSRNGPTELERATPAESLAPRLQALGHATFTLDMTSGLNTIERTANGWRAAADPRREGAARGD